MQAKGASGARLSSHADGAGGGFEYLQNDETQA